MHPILDALDGTPFKWIKKLLFTFNEGSIVKERKNILLKVIHAANPANPEN
jgi:hypothetical protein